MNVLPLPLDTWQQGNLIMQVLSSSSEQADPPSLQGFRLCARPFTTSWEKSTSNVHPQRKSGWKFQKTSKRGVIYQTALVLGMGSISGWSVLPIVDQISIIISLFSSVLLLFVGPQYHFLYIDVGCQGSASDAGIFRNSTLWKAIETNAINIPSPNRCHHQKIQYLMYLKYQ